MGIKASAQYTIAEIHEECNVVISNESHVFRANKDNTAVASSTSIQIYGYQGSTQIATTVGTISGLPSAGMTATINNNGKTNTSITVAVTTALTSSIANNGVLTIPITVAGKTFNKTFSWSKAQTGATGATGGAGKDGTSITISSTKTEYQVGSSATTAPTGTWSTTMQQPAQGQYLWTKTTVVYSDGSKTETFTVAYQGNDGADGAKGDKGDTGAAGKDGTGVTISSKKIEYVVTTTTTVPTSGWSTTFPTSIAQGSYLWTKTTVTYSDGTKTESYTSSYQGKNGTNGTNGTTARTYWITSSVNTITRSMKGTLTPGTITFGAYYRDGTSATSTAYSGRFIIQESANGTTWTTKYTSSANESSKVYTPTATTNLVRCAMYAAGGTTNKLDELTIGIIDGIDELEVGGRNFILDTKTAITFSDATTDKLVLSDYAKNLIKENDTLTLSFDAKASTSLFIDFYWRSSDTSYASTSFLPGTALTTEYQHFTFTSAAGLDLLTSKILYLRVRQNAALHGSATAVGTVEIKNVKLEKGTQASDWTPAPEDMEQDINDRPSREEVANNISNNIDAVNTTTDQKIAASIKDTDAKIEDVKGGFATQVDGVRKEVDAAGNVIRELENYATKFLITSNGMQMNIEKEKGANLIKNSVMIQHRDSSSGVQANYWDGFNTSLAITNAQIPNLASTNDGTSRANTDSGNYFSLDFTKNTSSMKYACLISNPVDFKLNASNILLSYKIRERSAINGKVFVGLIFYKNTDSSDKEISSKLCADLGTISTSAGFANARYVPVTEYSTGTMGNVFTEKVMYKTLPISRTQTAIVEESLPIQVVRDANDSSVILEKYVTLSYTPDSSNSTVTLVNYNGTTTGVTPTGTKVPLELSVNNDYAAVRYTRKLSNYVSMSSPTSAKIITELDGQNATDIKIYYDSSTKKIWVFNPFTGTYIASNNLYSDTVADTDINTVRVVIGAYGSAALTGIVDFSDLKLEYDTISTLWSSHQNEIYGKEYKMDEYGFSITTDTNQMFIDEDEIAAYEVDSSGNLKTDDPVFQIKKENTILRRTVIHNELLIENETATEDDAFIMKQQKVGSKWFYIFY